MVTKCNRLINLLLALSLLFFTVDPVGATGSQENQSPCQNHGASLVASVLGRRVTVSVNTTRSMTVPSYVTQLQNWQKRPVTTTYSRSASYVLTNTQASTIRVGSHVDLYATSTIKTSTCSVVILYHLQVKQDDVNPKTFEVNVTSIYPAKLMPVASK